MNMYDIIENLQFQGEVTTYEEFEYVAGTANEYDCWVVDLTSGSYFYYNELLVNNYDVVYFYDNEWYTITNIVNEDYPFEFREKYLSILTTRFFGRGLTHNYPKFVQFCKEYLGQCDDGFWKLASKISSFGNIDEMPDEILIRALEQYAIHFGFHVRSIPYFYDELTETLKYDNIRHFLRINKMFALTKGSPQSLFFMFEMFDGKLILRFPYKQLVKISDVKPILKFDGDNIVVDGWEESSYISCRDNDNENTLYHLHGEDETTGIKWAYYTAILETDLDIEKYKDVIEAIIKPTGVQYFWQQMVPQEISGVQNEEPESILIENDSLIPITIDNIQFPENYEGILLGRDTEYSSLVEGFEVPAATTFIILYRYIGNEEDWEPTKINIYNEEVLYIQVIIGEE